jgi:hypothetical protein
MADKRADAPDVEAAYAVSKAGYRPFDCSRQAMRREALAVLAEAGLIAPDGDWPNGASPNGIFPGVRLDSAKNGPADVFDFEAERARRDPNRGTPR